MNFYGIFLRQIHLRPVPFWSRNGQIVERSFIYSIVIILPITFFLCRVYCNGFPFFYTWTSVSRQSRSPSNAQRPKSLPWLRFLSLSAAAHDLCLHVIWVDASLNTRGIHSWCDCYHFFSSNSFVLCPFEHGHDPKENIRVGIRAEEQVEVVSVTWRPLRHAKRRRISHGHWPCCSTWGGRWGRQEKRTTSWFHHIVSTVQCRSCRGPYPEQAIEKPWKILRLWTRHIKIATTIWCVRNPESWWDKTRRDGDEKKESREAFLVWFLTRFSVNGTSY